MASIGSIFVDFVVRTAGMQDGIDNAVSQVSGGANAMGSSLGGVSTAGDAMANSIERGGLRVAAAFLGARSLAMALSREIQDVYKNIDDIPGVPQETIDSIRMMKLELSGSNSTIKQWGASALSTFSQIGQGIGFGLGALVYGDEAAADAYAQMQGEAAKFASAGHDKKMEELGLQAQRAAMNVGQLADSYLAFAQAQTAVANGNGTQTEKWKAQEEAAQAMISYTKEMASLKKSVSTTTGEKSHLDDEIDNRRVDIMERINQLMKERNDLDVQEAQIEGNRVGGALTGSQMSQLEALKKLSVQVDRELIPLLKKAREPMDELRNSFVNGFEGASNVLATFILKGKANFKDFFQSLEEQILSTIIKLSLINPIINSLFSGQAGFNSLPAFGAGTALFSGIAGFLADGGPAQSGQPYVVGEEGPELFVPNGSGTVVPNGARVSSSASGGGLHVHYNVESGVTRNDLGPILDQHAKRIKGEIYQAKQRGGTPARAMA